MEPEQIQITVRIRGMLVPYLDAFKPTYRLSLPARGVKHETAFEPVHGAPVFARCEPRLSILASQPVGKRHCYVEVRPLRENEKSVNEAWLSRKRKSDTLSRVESYFSASYRTSGQIHAEAFAGFRGKGKNPNQNHRIHTQKHTQPIVILTIACRKVHAFL